MWKGLCTFGKKIWNGARNALGFGEKGGPEITIVVPGITQPTVQDIADRPNYMPFAIIGAALIILFALRK